jgi:hypothetical protein
MLTNVCCDHEGQFEALSSSESQFAGEGSVCGSAIGLADWVGSAFKKDQSKINLTVNDDHRLCCNVSAIAQKRAGRVRVRTPGQSLCAWIAVKYINVEMSFQYLTWSRLRNGDAFC